MVVNQAAYTLNKYMTLNEKISLNKIMMQLLELQIVANNEKNMKLYDCLEVVLNYLKEFKK